MNPNKQDPVKHKTLVLGLGNPILSDDGVGVRVALALAHRLPPDSGIEISEASVGGLELMERLVGYDRVILIDAMKTGTHPPGTVQRMSLDGLHRISPTQHSASAHDTSLVTAWQLGQAAGLALPRDITILAVEVENIEDFSEEMTPAVTAAVPGMIADVLNLLGKIE